MFHDVAKMLLEPHGYDGREWAMSMAERLGIAGIAAHRRPPVAIEIGTFHGGSLSVISHYAEKVYSLDINPDCARDLGAAFPNVEFRTGPSQETLPPLLAELADEDIGLVLIDGDHSFAGVRRDIDLMLSYRPKGDLFILMHDSFNPYCRRAMVETDWASYPHVHWIDFDFIPGIFNSVPGFEDEMWGGFALAVVRAEARAGDLPRDELLGRQFKALFPLSRHAPDAFG